MEEWAVGPAQAESILDTARVEGWVPNKRRGGRPTATLDDPAPGPAPAPCSPALSCTPPSAPWTLACQCQPNRPLLPGCMHASASAS